MQIASRSLEFQHFVDLKLFRNHLNVRLCLLSFVSQGNKGGLSVRLSFYGHTVCFLNCHLAAHMQFALERVDEFEYIMDTQTFDCKKTPKVIDHRWGDEHPFVHQQLCITSYSDQGWCSGSEISTSGSKTMDFTLFAPASAARITIYCGAKTRWYLLKSLPHLWVIRWRASSLVWLSGLSLTVEHDEGQRRYAPAVWGGAPGLSAHVQVWLKLKYLW